MLDFLYVGVGAAILGAVLGWGYEHERFVKYQAHVEELSAEQQRITESINNTNQRKAKEIQSDYEKRIADIRSTYRGLHHPDTCPMPGTGKATAGTYGRPSYDALAESCAETTQQLVELQQFIRETQ